MNPSHSERPRQGSGSFLPLGIVFFLSGVPALLYQLCWQRMLFTVYGVNIESITVVVSAFMLGLGLGSLWGGRLATQRRFPPLLVFAWLEMTIAAFGLASPWIFAKAAQLTLGASLLSTGLLSFSLVVIPTLLMGASLPLLVAHLLSSSRNMGHAVGLLYFVNTLGSAAACFLAVSVTFPHLGLSGTIQLAAGFNALVAAGAFLVHLRGARSDPGTSSRERSRSPSDADAREEAMQYGKAVPFALVLGLAAISGFISLAYEVVLSRAYSFVSAGRASAFPFVLGWYLVGIALGSLLSGLYCRHSKRERQRQVATLGVYFLVVNVLGFITIPLLADAVKSVSFETTYPLVALLSGGLGATLPLVAHIGIEADHRAPQRLSYVYVANIIGSTSGSLATGFWAMDVFDLPTIATSLSLLGTLVACALLVPNSSRRTKLAAALLALTSTGAILVAREDAYFQVYEKLMLKEEYAEHKEFRKVVEGRSGVVTVTRGGMVFGGGIYDGQLSVDLVYDRNGLVRPFALGAFHPKPERVLVIGLATGAWAQVIIHHPDVRSLVAVEINPGYLEVIRGSEPVRSLLTNNKFRVVIDDGRRWLARNPEEKFDLIVMNTTFHWHAYAANLLSLEFLREVSRHLSPGGIAIYNTTSSSEAQRTGAVVFPHALRFINNMLVSNDPLVADAQRFRELLTRYRIDGKPVIDVNDAHHRARLDHIVGLLDTYTSSPELEGFEKRADVLARTRGARLITDDNMGTEWTHDFDEEE